MKRFTALCRRSRNKDQRTVQNVNLRLKFLANIVYPFSIRAPVFLLFCFLFCMMSNVVAPWEFAFCTRVQA